MCTVATAMLRPTSRFTSIVGLRRPRPGALVALLRRPTVLLALVLLLSTAARLAWLGEPCRSPCRAATDHTLVFDEAYYVNAARVIAGVRPPAGASYAQAPLGDDPNAEHPQLAKLLMAAMIKLFGDGPFAWRIWSVVFGTVAILGMFALVRAAGGSSWIGLAAALQMSCDNLLLVHGRIGTLDIYALAGMIWGAAVYLRGRPWLAGLVIGVAACAKEVAPYVLLVLVLYELLGWLVSRGGVLARLRRLAGCVIVSWAAFFALLGVLGLIAPPYNDAAARPLTGGPFKHFAHIVHYAAGQTSPHGPKGIASYPWWWLVDYKPITYLTVNPSLPGDGLYAIKPPVHFIGIISPPILVVGLPALLIAAVGLVRRRRGPPSQVELVGRRPPPSGVGILSLAWFAGTFVPFVLLTLIWQRTSYLYYMLIVMPGIYLAAGRLLEGRRLDRRGLHVWLVGVWVASLVVAAAILYPLTPISLP
jgi:hypothetical protein